MNLPTSNPTMRMTWVAASIAPVWLNTLTQCPSVALTAAGAGMVASYLCNRITSKDDSGAAARETMEAALRNNDLAKIAAQAVKLSILSFQNEQFPVAVWRTLAETAERRWLEIPAEVRGGLTSVDLGDGIRRYENSELVIRLIEHLSCGQPDSALPLEFWTTFLRDCARRNEGTVKLGSWVDWDAFANHVNRGFHAHLYNSFKSEDSAGYRGVVLRLLCDIAKAVGEYAPNATAEYQVEFVRRFDHLHTAIQGEAAELGEKVINLDHALRSALARLETINQDVRALIVRQGVVIDRIDATVNSLQRTAASQSEKLENIGEALSGQGRNITEVLQQIKALQPLVTSRAPSNPIEHRGYLRQLFRGPNLQRRNREAMLQRLQTYWIDGVLNQALNEANRFTVGYELAPDAVLHHVDFGKHEIPATMDISSVYHAVGEKILILGIPGSGKTILLLQLAKHLLSVARQEPSARIPIVLNLMSWWRHREPLATWIVNETAESYQIPRRVVRTWLAEEAIVPLLDGLDEVPLELRWTPILGQRIG